MSKSLLPMAGKALASSLRVTPRNASGRTPTRAAALVAVLAAAISLSPLIGAAGRSHGAVEVTDQDGGSAREKPCGPPMPVAVERRLRAQREIPDDELIDITSGDLRFRVPHAYLAPRSSLHTVGCRNYRKSFGFSFWWPDLKPTEYDAFLYGGFRPKELSRPNPDPSASVIHVNSIIHVSDRYNADYITPVTRMSNLRKNLAPMTFIESEEFGLTKHVSSQENYPFIYYGRYSGSESSIYLRCDAYRKLLYEICDGHVFYKSEGIAFFLYFLKEELPRWELIIGSAHRLLKSWQVLSQTTNPQK